MRIGKIGAMVAGVVVVIGALWFFARSTPGQEEFGALARTEDGKPDLNGIWQSFTTANWDIEAHDAQPGPHPEIMGAWGAQPGGMGIVEGGEIPYKPEALVKKQENFKNRMQVKVTNDPRRFDTGEPELQCYRPGVPRANYMPYPFQIFQNQEQILIVYEYKGASRTVYMEPHMDAPADSWMGWSNGTLGRRHARHRRNGVQRLRLVRSGWKLRQRHAARRRALDSQKVPNHIMYEATIEDPAVFTRAWKISFPIYRRLEPNIQLVEFNCVPFVEEMMYAPLGLFYPPDTETR